MSLEAFPHSIAASRKVVDAARELGFNISFLDIGGGIPGFDDREITTKMVLTLLGY
jgi:diaminopimelate decarboxylase